MDGAEINSANSRDVYEYLGIGTQYSIWIQRAIDKYGFEEGIDFIKVNQKRLGQDSIDYIVTIDMAKELCMVSNTPKGKETRRYFIAVDKKAALTQIPDFNDPITSARAWADAKEAEAKALVDVKAKEILLEKKDQTILAVADLNIQAGDVSMSEFAKNLKLEVFDKKKRKVLGRNQMFELCRDMGIFMIGKSEPYQNFVDDGYFTMKPSPEKVNGKIRYTPYLTPRGTVWLTKKLKEHYGQDLHDVDWKFILQGIKSGRNKEHLFT